MSVWYELSISIRSDSKVSVKRVIQSSWGGHLEVVFSNREVTSYGRTNTSLSVCGCGIEVLGDIKKLLCSFKEFDPKCDVNITVNNLFIY